MASLLQVQEKIWYLRLYIVPLPLSFSAYFCPFFLKVSPFCPLFLILHLSLSPNRNRNPNHHIPYTYKPSPFSPGNFPLRRIVSPTSPDCAAPVAGAGFRNPILYLDLFDWIFYLLFFPRYVFSLIYFLMNYAISCQGLFFCMCIMCIRSCVQPYLQSEDKVICW